MASNEFKLIPNLILPKGNQRPAFPHFPRRINLQKHFKKYIPQEGSGSLSIEKSILKNFVAVQLGRYFGQILTEIPSKCHPNSPSPTNFVYICISEDFGGHSECYLSPRGPVSELHKWNKWSGEKGWKGAHKYTKNKYTNTQNTNT